MNTVLSKYYQHEGKYYDELDKLVEGYVPGIGRATTIFGEHLRAVCNLQYDAYNNGWINNTSGALNYLKRSWVLRLSDNWSVISAALETMTDNAVRQEYADTTQQMADCFDMMFDTLYELFQSDGEKLLSANNEDIYDYIEEPEEEEEYCYYCGDSTDWCRNEECQDEDEDNYYNEEE